MPNYRAHGLTLASNRPLAQLVESTSDALPDIHIVFDEISGSAPAWDARHTFGASEPWFAAAYDVTGRPGLVATRRGSGRWLQFAYADGPLFVVDAAATTIRVRWPSDVTVDDTVGYLLGPVMGILLRLRGLTCLHASAVDIGGRAYAFVGPAGAGKSTMAAAFADAGFPVLSDDTVTLRPEDEQWWVAPGYPRLRLWPDAVRAIDVTDRSRRMDAATSNRYHFDLAAGNLFAREAVPLAAVYLIEFNEALAGPAVTALSPAEVLPELSANTFANRVLDREGRAGEFTSLVDLLEAIPARRLARPQNLSGLAAVRAAVLDDIGFSERHASG